MEKQIYNKIFNLIKQGENILQFAIKEDISLINIASIAKRITISSFCNKYDLMQFRQILTETKFYKSGKSVHNKAIKAIYKPCFDFSKQVSKEEIRLFIFFYLRISNMITQVRTEIEGLQNIKIKPFLFFRKFGITKTQAERQLKRRIKKTKTQQDQTQKAVKEEVLKDAYSMRFSKKECIEFVEMYLKGHFLGRVKSRNVLFSLSSLKIDHTFSAKEIRKELDIIKLEIK